MKVLVSLLIALAAALAGAQSGYGPRQLPFKELRSGQMCTAQSGGAIVIQNEQALRQFWNRTMHQPSDPPTGVDWQTQQVVALCVGRRSTGGYSIAVDNILLNPGVGVTVYWVELVPQKGMITTDALTSPWSLVTMPRRSELVSFIKSTEPWNGVRRKGSNRCCHNCRCGQTMYTLQGGGLRISKPTDNLLEIVKWRTYKEGQNSIVKGFETHVINNDAQFQSYWKHAFGTSVGNAATAGIDWARECMVAVHLGPVPRSGYKVYVETIEKPTPDNVQVNFNVIIPHESMPKTDGTFNPWCLVRLDRCAGSYSFQRRDMRMVPIPVWCRCGCPTCGKRCIQ